MVMRGDFGSAMIVAVASPVLLLAALTGSCNPPGPTSQQPNEVKDQIGDSPSAKADSITSKTSSGITEEARKEASDIFKDRCVTCHGEQGRGDGPGASNLMPKPMDFHNSNWQVSVSDADIAKAIVKGGSAVGLSSQMQPNPDLEDKPGVVAALVARIRQWAK
jgi:mono/diheme cytochrome c family protein